MKYEVFKKKKIPGGSGVYLFLGRNKKVLYVGKATSLRDRVRSYFSKDIVTTRGTHIVRMVDESVTITWQSTDSVLEALVLEANLIRKFQPPYNTKERDNKSFNHIVITREAFPRVLVVRGRDLEQKKIKGKPIVVQRIFGPFPQGSVLKEGIKIIRKIFPFRDLCIPKNGKPCFNRQINLCPGVCSGEISQQDYKTQIHYITLFLSGKKKEIIRELTRDMKYSVKKLNFENAGIIKKMLFALNHIQDIALMKREKIASAGSKTMRIEAFDAAHLGGSSSVAVMTVISDGEVDKGEYRKFKLRLATDGDDLSSLEEVLRRRFNHPEWKHPDFIVVDGGKLQFEKAVKTLQKVHINTEVIAVIKNEFHKPKGFLGDKAIIEKYGREILLANSEAHRFAISYHRELRGRLFRGKGSKSP